MTTDWSSLYKKDDWWALWIGMLLFFVSLPSYYGVYLFGWVPAASSWTNVTSAISTKLFNPWVGLVAVFVFLLVLLTPVMKLVGVKALNWIRGFTTIFAISWAIWIASNYTPVIKTMGSAEVGFVIALLVGIVIANVARVPVWLKESARGEFFIKTAIVLLGAKILFTTLATSGLAILGAVFISFPVVWLIAYLMGRRSGLDQSFSATLSSGVSVCGVSASIATASAIDAPPLYASIVSSIIVIFSAFEIIVMPLIASLIFPSNASAAGVWMGLSVKTDGAAAASGSVVDGLIGANGSALNSAILTKVMLDVWIGLIAFVLAVVWTYRVQRGSGKKASPLMVWYKFPKFVIGYFAASGILTLIALTYPTVAAGAKAVAPVVSFGTDPFRVMFFVFTFLAIGLGTDFSKFREVGIRKPVAVYAAALAVAVIWGGIVSYFLFP
jgi:uncharacterized membrane protein YadS